MAGGVFGGAVEGERAAIIKVTGSVDPAVHPVDFFVADDYAAYITPIKKPAAHRHRLNRPAIGQPGSPLGTRGFPSHKCSWFGFVKLN